MDAQTGLLTPPASPIAERKELKLAGADKTPGEKKLDVDELKELLGFRGFHCLCLTKANKPCPGYSLTKNRSKIPTQLNTVLPLTQASKELRKQLEILAQLGHCFVHRHRRYVESSADRWIPDFPGPPPLTELIERAIKKQTRLCFHSDEELDDYESKRKQRGGRKVQNYTKTVPEVAKAAIASMTGGESELEDYEYLLQVLAYNALCEDHQFHGEYLIKEWKEKISAILKGDERPLTPPADAAALESATELCDNTSEVVTATGTTKNNTDKREEAVNQRDPSKHWLSEFDERGFEVLGKNNLKGPVSSYNRVQKKLETALNENKKETTEGFIYIYKIKGHDNLVKIGSTLRTVALRHEEWAFSCNREVISIHPEGKDVKKVKYARRIEALCHDQLAHCNVQVYCDACMTEHKEWFKIGTKEAIAIVKNWSKWAESEPYECKMGEDKKVAWTLKKGEQSKIEDMTSFMQRLSQSAE